MTDQLFPAVPGMVDLVDARRPREGYAIFFLTGRPARPGGGHARQPDRRRRRRRRRLPAADDAQQRRGRPLHEARRRRLPGYLKAACAGDPNGSCTTIHYKSATRAHIESLGYDIVANFGDQFSDLEGGFADRTFKLPNPNYFLP